MKAISTARARSIIGALWLLGSSLICGALFLQTLLGQVYDDKGPEVLEWVGAVLWPSTTLIVGVLAAEGLAPRSKAGDARLSFFFLTLFAVTVYLVGVAACVVMQVLRPDQPAIELLEAGKPWLLLFQGALSALLAAFFWASPVQEQGSSQERAFKPAANEQDRPTLAAGHTEQIRAAGTVGAGSRGGAATGDRGPSH